MNTRIWYMQHYIASMLSNSIVTLNYIANPQYQHVMHCVNRNIKKLSYAVTLHSTPMYQLFECYLIGINVDYVYVILSTVCSETDTLWSTYNRVIDLCKLMYYWINTYNSKTYVRLMPFVTVAPGVRIESLLGSCNNVTAFSRLKKYLTKYLIETSFTRQNGVNQLTT